MLRYELDGLDLLRVEYPETVRVLESRMFGAKLSQFKNVECLRCTSDDHGFLHESTLQNLKQLKEVHYDLTIDCFGYADYEEVMQALKNFLKQKRKLGRSDLKVYDFNKKFYLNFSFGIYRNSGRIRIKFDLISILTLFVLKFSNLKTGISVKLL